MAQVIVQEAVTGMAQQAGRFSWDIIWQEFKYFWDYDTNIEKLENKIKDLGDKKDRLQILVGEAKRNAEVIMADVSSWLDKVDDVTEKANQILNRIKDAQWECRCICYEGPKPQSRWNLGKQVANMTIEIAELLDASKFETIGCPAPPGSMPFSSPEEYDGFESRIEVRNDVMKALRDDSITVIGISGMPGVGKTTLVKEIADKVKEEILFDEVAMAVVSNDAVITKIQDQLAESLGLKIEQNTDRPRAERLYARLMRNDSRILVILDDVWKEIGLRNIGIPVKGERKGLKILLTSRFERVCNNMEAKLFQVKVLSEAESWHLFKETANIFDEANDVTDIAKEVAKECGGLPLSIVVVGKTFMNEKEHGWRDALKQLQMSNIQGMHYPVYSRIKLSYDHLESADHKKLLLLCSLFPEDDDIPPEILVKYTKGLKLFKNVETIGEVGDRVNSVIDKLESCYLLRGEFNWADEKCVKLHDVIRDVCLSIASDGGEDVYMVRHGGLKEWPQEDSNASYTSISLSFDFIDVLSSSIECPNLKLLRLAFKETGLNLKETQLADDFFKVMNNLKVLHLINLRSHQLPSSLQFLVNLQTLCLEVCILSGHLSVIGTLKKLEILSFHMSYVEQFPYEISELSNLKSLDLRYIQGPPISYDFLHTLKKMDELYLGSSDYKYMPFKCLVSELNKNCFNNLKKLNLIVCDNIKYLVDTSGFDTSGNGGVFVNLEELIIREAKNLEELCHGNLPHGSFARLRELHLEHAPKLRHLWGSIQPPSLGHLRILYIRGCESIKSVFLQSSVVCLGQLQEIIITNCQRIETFVSSDEEECSNLNKSVAGDKSMMSSFGAESNLKILFRKVMLPKLRTLEIHDLLNIRCIFDDQMSSGSFSKLQSISVSQCGALVHIAESETIKELKSLEELDIWNCESLEVVFDFEGLLCQLRSLKFSDVPNLKDICTRLPEKFVFKNLKSIRIQKSNKLRYLFLPSVVKAFVSLEYLYLTCVDEMEAIIGMEEREISEIEFEEESTIEFPNLKYLECLILDNSRMLCSANADLVLPSLTELKIGGCEKMEIFCVGKLSAPNLQHVMVCTSTESEWRTIAMGEFNFWLQECQSGKRCFQCSLHGNESCEHFNEQLT